MVCSSDCCCLLWYVAQIVVAFFVVCYSDCCCLLCDACDILVILLYCVCENLDLGTVELVRILQAFDDACDTHVTCVLGGFCETCDASVLCD